MTKTLVASKFTLTYISKELRKELDWSESRSEAKEVFAIYKVLFEDSFVGEIHCEELLT